MSNYTAEQVAMAFRAGFIEAAKWPSVCTQDADSEAVYEAADAYAATLRQQAFSQFANPEALADWLDALHECHADGSVGNRKWEAAQVAARAIRSLNEPSGNSGQLRQQAGRVDEEARTLLQEARDQIHSLAGGFVRADQLITRIDAALAQNTQGEAVAELWIGSPSSEGTTAYGFDRLPLMCDLPPGKYPLYLHAERARVPADELVGRAYRRWYAAAKGFRNVVADAAHDLIMDEADRLAAAPSQRAEVE